MKNDVSWSHTVAVHDIPEEGKDITLVADEEARAALARFADIVAVRSLSARLHLIPDGEGGAVLTGELDATVRQNCIVSLEPFDNKVVEEIVIRFAPETAKKHVSDPDIDPDEADPSDTIRDGMIDLGAVVSEFFYLGVDPYPRKPGVVFTPLVTEGDKRENPFAALEKLKQKGRSSK